MRYNTTTATSKNKNIIKNITQPEFLSLKKMIFGGKNEEICVIGWSCCWTELSG